MSARSHCTFCDLINGAGEVSVCYEDSDALAFMDIQPVNAGHVLVAPRQHFASLFDLPRDLGDHLFKITMRMASAVRRVTGCDDMNIVVSSGAAAGQDVFHYHVHIIPRRPGDGFDVQLPFGGSEMPDRTMLDAMAARIIAAMRDPLRNRAPSGGRSSDTEPPADRSALSAEREADGERRTASRDLERPLLVARESGPSHRPLHRLEGAHGELVREDVQALA
jgi:histidine triad (HIT) family protein